jgi:hypothetical protein
MVLRSLAGVLTAAFLAGFLASACTQQSADPPPTGRMLQQQAPAPLAATGTSAVAIPANRWRAVLIAGDNNSPAFDNGVEAMREKLAARGVRDIRVLTSDPAANPSLTVATAANVAGALRSPGGEACLAFITSHGEQSGFVLRPARGTVSPASLVDALDAGCGARPTVVVVSACYSGVFLTPAMRRPNRVVLSAAASDRPSFGCGTDDEYTYYDQCLLKQFDGAATWAQLAAATRSCVADLERRMGIRRPSQPQIFVGSGVAELRIPGQ